MDSEKPAPPPAAKDGGLPWVKLRSASPSPQIYKRMVSEVDPAAKPGDIVAVYDKSGNPYGVALYNPRSLITLRRIARDPLNFDIEKHFAERIDAAVAFRRLELGLDEKTDAYRLIHDMGDGMPGMVADRYGDFIVLEFYSLCMFKQAERIERLFRFHYPNATFIRGASQYTQTMEGFKLKDPKPARTRIRENGIAFEVEPGGGYKTGFFCDQRENRLAFAALAKGKRVLDVCSYTGGFGLYAAKAGAEEVTSVELDPEASALAKKNANLNGVRLNTVCVDAFPYLRQAAANKELFDLIVCDPYKFIASQEGHALGRQKYIDLNKLALGVLAPRGILLTNSCSGMLGWEEFQQIVRVASGVMGRRVQIIKKSGAGPDHPVATDYPEGEYLKAIWARAL
jgi:23S rRNA (cytosine1962-C5)-methyltransferase